MLVRFKGIKNLRALSNISLKAFSSQEQPQTKSDAPIEHKKDGKTVVYNNPYTGELFETNFLSKSQMKDKID